MTDGSITAHFRVNYPSFNLDVNLQLPGQGVTALFGHSGSGKTTLLRCIAGLEHGAGRLLINGDIWQEHNIFLPTHKRPLGYVFQEANLFPHLTVMGNLKYGMSREPRKNLRTSLDQSIELLGIGHLLERRPEKLSGGERQRVAIARALAVNPRLLLMDEPLAALDLARKREILPFLERLHDELEIPIFYVTHSPDEVARLADHLVVMASGKAAASGSLSETLARLDLPIHLGEETGVVLKGHIVEFDPRWNLARAAFPGGYLWVRDMGFGLGASVRLRILARDVSLALEPYENTSFLNLLPAVVCELGAGDHSAVKMAKVKVGESYLLCRLTDRSVHMLELSVGKSVWAQIKSVAIIE
ncbi:MAG: molybdenum ABC transporter ATP-binding protein [Gammaproteobacteria bacterium]